MPADYISALEATRILRIRPQTLYAYVSRGAIRSVVQPGSKAKLYSREDVQRAGSRSAARSGHGAVAASAMNWGQPIISSLITEITAQGPRYRGHLASDLATDRVGFEAVAELLWSATPPVVKITWPVASAQSELPELRRRFFSGASGGNLLESFAMVVLLLGMKRGSVEDRVRQGETLVAARQIMQILVGCCGFATRASRQVHMRPDDDIVHGMARAFGVAPSEENALAMEAMLVLLADHELSPGTLSARVVASGGGTLHSCVAAALCASSGVDIGRGYDQVDSFLGQARSVAVLVKRAARLVQHGQAVPGFQHPLYPKGDPRADHLLAIASKHSAQTPWSRAVFGFIEHMRTSGGLYPRQELAVVLLTRLMGLEAPAPMAVFALARLAGWVAHVIEQRERGTLLRPRARYQQTG